MRHEKSGKGMNNDFFKYSNQQGFRKQSFLQLKNYQVIFQGLIVL